MTGRIEQLEKEYDIDLRWRAFPLHPETPVDGQTLEQLFTGSTVNIAQMLERLKSVAEGLGLPFGTRKYTYNSRLAQELGLWAEEQGRGHDFHMAAFRAYFAEGKNLAKPEVLMYIVESLDLPLQAAQTVIDERSFAAQVDRDWQLSRTMQVTAVPTFIIKGKALVGAQPYSELEKFVRGCGVKPRTAG